MEIKLKVFTLKTNIYNRQSNILDTSVSDICGKESD